MVQFPLVLNNYIIQRTGLKTGPIGEVPARGLSPTRDREHHCSNMYSNLYTKQIIRYIEGSRFRDRNITKNSMVSRLRKTMAKYST